MCVVLQYVPRPSVPVANNKAAPTGGGTKRNPGRQSHVITSNGHNKDQNQENQNGSVGTHNNLDNSETTKHVIPPDKSETVSKATGAAAAAAQAVSKYSDISAIEILLILSQCKVGFSSCIPVKLSCGLSFWVCTKLCVY